MYINTYLTTNQNDMPLIGSCFSYKKILTNFFILYNSYKISYKICSKYCLPKI